MVKRKQDISPKLRILKMQRAILESHNGFTIKQFAQRFDVSIDTIRRDFVALENSGLFLTKDSRHRYTFKKEQEYKQLKDLLHFSEEDQIILHKAIDSVSPHTKRAEILKKKLASIYDFRKLGLSYLKRPYLQKLNKINGAIKNKIQIKLNRYSSSNSNIISDRIVEPFHIDISNDILYAFEIKSKGIRNFKISRIERITLTNDKWKFEGHHNITHSDPFRISSKKMINVHLRITLAGKNELEERYPLSKAFITESEEEGSYDYQCDVNNAFLGLDNFILGFHREILEIISPDILIEHLKKDIEKIKNIEGFY